MDELRKDIYKPQDWPFNQLTQIHWIKFDMFVSTGSITCVKSIGDCKMKLVCAMVDRFIRFSRSIFFIGWKLLVL